MLFVFIFPIFFFLISNSIFHLLSVQRTSSKCYEENILVELIHLNLQMTHELVAKVFHIFLVSKKLLLS